MHGCPKCQNVAAVDITRGPIAGLADDSAVVFVSCVLEYVADLQAARRELLRIAGTIDNIFLVTVQPWSLTSRLYPGARWAGGAAAGGEAMSPVTTTHKLAAGGVLALLGAIALWPSSAR